MMRKSINARRFLQVLTLIVALSFSFGHVYAQLKVSTTVPTSDSAFIQVGYHPGVFSIVVTDTVTTPITVTKLTVTPPSGVSFANAPIIITLKGVLIPGTLNGNIITTSIPLQPNDSATVTFQMAANCSAIPNSASSFSIFLFNNVTVYYIYQGVTLNSKIKTDTYPVLYPGLQVRTPASPYNYKTVEWQQNVTDTITIVNAENAGTIGNMLFTMRYPDVSAISVTGMSLLGSNGIAIPVTPTVNGSTLQVTITPALLLSVGFTDSAFHQLQTLHAIVHFHVNTYFSSLQTTYTIQSAAYGSVCDSTENASGIIYYAQPTPAPQLSDEFESFTPTDLCGKTGTFVYTVTNTAPADIMNTALHITLPFNFSAIQILSANIGSTSILQDGAFVLPSVNPDGSGTGLEDIDGDGIYNDLAPGQSFTITGSFQYIVGSCSNFGMIGAEIWAQTFAKSLDEQQKSISTDYVLSEMVMASLTATASSDIDNGVSTTCQASYSFNSQNNYELFTSPISTFISCYGVNTTVLSTGGTNVPFSFVPQCSPTPPFPVTLNFATEGCTQSVVIGSYSLDPVIHGCTPPPPSDTNPLTPPSGSGDSTAINNPPVPCSQVFEASITTVDNSTVYTGQSFNISSSASMTITGNCADFQQVVVTVYALSGDDIFDNSLTQGDLNVNGLNYSATPVRNGSQLIYTFTGQAITTTTQFTFTSHLGIVHAHLPFDIALENIRVAYSINQFNDSRGAMITVVDPKLTANITHYGSSNIDDNLCIGVSPSVVLSPSLASDNVSTVILPAVSEFSYNNITVSYKGTNAVVPVTTNTDGSVTVPVNITFTPGESACINFRLVPDACINNDTTIMEPSEIINYNDFLYAPPSSSPSPSISINASDVTFQTPKLSFNVTQMEQSVQDTTVWTLDIDNNGSATATNMMISLQPDAGNVEIISIAKVTYADGTAIPLTQQGNTWYANVGSIPNGTQKEIHVMATYQNCTQTGVSTINVQGAWSQNQLNTSNFTQYACPLLITQLQLENMTAVLNATEHFPSKPYEFGAIIPINVTINNTGRADLDSLGFWFSKFDQNATTLIGNDIHWNFKGTQDSIIDNKISKGQSLFGNNLLLSTKILENQNFVLNGNDSTIDLNFNVQFHCSQTSSNTTIVPIMFETQGTTNCGQLQQKTFRYTPQIKGFEGLQYIQVQSSAQSATTYKGTSTVNISVTNTDSVKVDDAYITMIIPKDMSLSSTIPAANTSIVNTTSNPNTDGTTTVEWELANGVHLEPGQTVSLVATLQDAATCPPSQSTISIAGTLKRTLVDVSTGDSCQVSESTDAIIDTIQRVQSASKISITGTTAICSGSSTTLIVVGASPYSWSDGDVTASTTVTPATNTTYSVTTTTAEGCIGTASATVTVNPNPVISIADGSVCTGSIFTFVPNITNGTLPYSYSWSNGITTANNSVSSTGSYTLSVSDNNGCKAVSSANLVQLPTPTVTTSASQSTVCAGASSTITTTGATSYVWSNAATTAAITVTPTATTTYTVTGTNASGCSNTANVAIIVNTTPTIVISPTTTSVCSGFSTTLTASGANSYIWSNGVVGTAINVSPTTNTTYTVTGTSGNCSASALTTVMVAGKPAVATSITGRDTLCWNTQNEPYSVAVGDDAPSSWVLNPTSAGTVTPQGTSVLVSIASGFSGNVTLQAIYNQTACSQAVITSKTIDVLKQPIITDYRQTDTAWYCSLDGGQAYLGYMIKPNDMIQYTVWNADNSVNSTSNYINYAVATSTNQVDKYTFEISHRLCPLPTIDGTIYLARSPLPIASASATSVCMSDTMKIAVNLVDVDNCQFRDISFDASFDVSRFQFSGVSLKGSMVFNQMQGGTVIDHTVTATPVAGGTHIHVNDVDLDVPTNSQVLVTLLFVPLQAGTSTVTISNIVYNTAGTYTNAVPQLNIPITVYPNPVISLSNASVCTGSTYTFIPNVTSGTTPYSYLWSNGTTTVSNPVSAGNYILTVTDANGCKAVSTANVSQLPLPTISVSANPLNICIGATSTITASGAATYLWSNSATDVAITVTPTATTTYTVTGTANGCTATASAAVTVNPLPTLTTSASPTAICLGTSSTISATGASTYSWNNGLGSGASKTVSPTTTTTYTVIGTNTAGCINTATVSVNVNSLPTLTTSANQTAICLGASSTISATGASSYSWSNGLGIGASKTVSPTATSTYTVTGTDVNGCVGTAARIVTVNPLPSVTVSPVTIAVCAGATTTLAANGASIYSWSNSLTGTSITVTPASTTTYIVTGTNTVGCSNTATSVVTVKPLPTISAISGSLTSSAGTTATYSVTSQTGITFNWSVTNGTILSGAGTNQVSIKFTAMPATIQVYASNNGCTSNNASITVTQTPVAITGNLVDCKNDATSIDYFNYSVSSPKTGAVYTWSISSGADFNTSSTTTGTTVNIRFLSGLGVVTITVTERINGQVTGIGSLVVNKNVRPTVGAISGASGWGGVCLTQEGVAYSVTGTNAPSFVWTVPTGDVITAGQGTNNIKVNFNQAAGNIVVFGQNGDGCLSNQGSYLYVAPNGICPINFLQSPIDGTTRILNTSDNIPGTVKGDIDVSQNGVVSLSIPILVSPGSHNLHPSLGITYSNQSGRGDFGFGWNLSGISSITRVPKNLYFDGAPDIVNMNTSDALVLNGQRLISTGANTYSPENDPYTKVVANSSGYIVTTPDGTTIEYGMTADSRFIPKNCSASYTWSANKYSDPDKNYIEYTYIGDNTTGEYHINQINYTGNSNTGAKPYNSIQFYYSKCSDVNTGYASNCTLSQSMLIDSIQVLAEGQISKNYRFSYFLDQYPKLNQIKLTVDGISYNPTIINWGTSNYTATTISDAGNSSTVAALGSLHNNKLYFGDLDGDGTNDVIKWDGKTNISATFSCSTTLTIPALTYTPTDITVADWNNDGKDEILVHSVVSNVDKVVCYALVNGVLSVVNTKQNVASSNVYQYYYDDINNDGLLERIVVINGIISSIENSSGTILSTSYLNGIQYIKMEDIDGDGQPEIIATTYNGTLIDNILKWKVVGGVNTLSTISQYQSSTSGIIPSSNVYYGDFNGDGRNDKIVYDGTTWKVYYFNGSSFDLGTAPSGLSPASGTTTMRIIDINGDGKSDILQAVNGDVSLYISNGSSFTQISPAYHVSSVGSISKVFLDVQSILCSPSSTTDPLQIVYGNDDAATHENYKIISFNSILNGGLLVNNITDGNNNTTNISYKYKSTASTTIQPAFPFRLIVQPMFLPDELITKVNGDVYSDIKYTFQNAFIHLQGKGFLGFQSFIVNNLITNNVSTSTFNNTISDGAGNSNVCVWKSGTNTTQCGSPISSQTTSMQAKAGSMANKLFYPLAVSISNNDYLKNISSTFTIGSFDPASGNTLENKTVTSDGWTIENNYTYNLISGNEYNLASNITKQTFGSSTYTKTTNYAYGNSSFPHRVTSINNQGLTTTTFTSFDGYGNATGVSVAAIDGTPSRSMGNTYDTYGRFVQQSVDVNGYTSLWNHRGCDGALLSSTDPNGLTTTNILTPSSNSYLSKTIFPDGNSTNNTLSWDNSGTGLYSVQADESNGNTSTTYFNAKKQMIKDTHLGFNGMVITNSYVYNKDGSLLSHTDNAGNTTYKTYNCDGRIAGEVGLNLNTTYSYSGNQMTMTDNLLQTSVTKTYDAMGNITHISGTNGDISYNFYGSGKIKSITSGGGVTSMTYDPLSLDQLTLTDPDVGTITNKYNKFGQLLSQTDAKGQVTTYGYDALGHVISKTGPGLSESYVYSSNTGSLGMIQSITRDNAITESYTYDNLGRIKTQSTVGPVKSGAANSTFLSSYTYNNKGRVSSVSYPSGLTVNYVYDAVGNLTQINNNTGGNIWTANSVNALEQMTQYSLGNGLITKFGYDQTYKLNSIKTGITSNETSILNLGYTFNAGGQLTQRTDGNNSLSETFQYDALNRLTQDWVGGTDSTRKHTYSYAANGNITNTSIAGDYTYSTTHPHAVSDVAGVVGVNGTNNSPTLTTLSNYNVDNKILNIDNGTYRNDFVYGVDGQRFRVDFSTSGNLQRTKVYVDNNEFGYDASGNVVYKRTIINSPTGVCAVWQDSAKVQSLYYVHTDYLGSWLDITDSTGKITNTYSYDAWGRPRNPSTWAMKPVSITNALGDLNTMQPRFDRGYTGHEIMAGLGLINMNGRLYDPYLQRFLSPDNYVQNPLNAQNYNRYSYCNNNPLYGIDPSGNVVIFIGGFTTFGKNWQAGDSRYWSYKDEDIMNQIGDHNARYYDGHYSKWGEVEYDEKQREWNGIAEGESQAKIIYDGLDHDNGETIKIVAHSMGCAYAKGFVLGLEGWFLKNHIQKNLVEFEIDLSPYEPGEQDAVSGVPTIQISHWDDPVAGNNREGGVQYHGSGSGGHSVTSYTNEITEFVPHSNHNSNIYNKVPMGRSGHPSRSWFGRNISNTCENIYGGIFAVPGVILHSSEVYGPRILSCALDFAVHLAKAIPPLTTVPVLSVAATGDAASSATTGGVVNTVASVTVSAANTVASTVVSGWHKVKSWF